MAPKPPYTPHPPPPRPWETLGEHCTTPLLGFATWICLSLMFVDWLSFACRCIAPSMPLYCLDHTGQTMAAWQALTNDAKAVPSTPGSTQSYVPEKFMRWFAGQGQSGAGQLGGQGSCCGHDAQVELCLQVCPHAGMPVTCLSHACHMPVLPSLAVMQNASTEMLSLQRHQGWVTHSRTHLSYFVPGFCLYLYHALVLPVHKQFATSTACCCDLHSYCNAHHTLLFTAWFG